MDVLLIMCLGILAGRFLIPEYTKKGNELLALSCTFFLIFSMGATLGQDENLISNLSSLGFSSLLFFLFPTGLSILLVYLLTKKFMKPEEKSQEKEVDK